MGLIRKKDGYYFRGYIPKVLSVNLGKKTQDKKLFTKNKKEALRLIKKVKIEFDYYILGFGMDLNSKIIENKLNSYINESLKIREEQLFNLPNTEVEELLSKGYFYDRIEAFQDALSYKDCNFLPNIDDIIRNSLDELYDDLTDSQINEYKYNLIEKLLRQESFIRQRVIDGYYNFKNYPDENFIEKTILVKENDSEPNLIKSYDKFMDTKSKNSNLTTDTINKHKLVLKSLLMYFKGDINVDNITRENIENYRDTLEKLPKRWNIREEFKDLETFEEIIEKNNEIEIPYETLSITTIQDKYMGKVKEFFNDINPQVNLVNNLKYDAKKYNNAKIETKEFTNEELEKMFNTSFYTKELEKNIKNNIEKVFAPILALYSTMRLNELSSLYLEDIKKDGNVYFFDINYNKDKTVKEDKSKRFIPIHPKIIEAGFLEYYHFAKKQGYNRLWQNLTKIKKYEGNNEEGLYSKQISNWFQRFNDIYVTKDKSKKFHSFRNNAIDNLKQNSNANYEQRYAIQGHSSSTDSRDFKMDNLYSNPKNAKALFKFVKQMKYDVSSLDVAIKNIKKEIDKIYLC